MKFVELKKSLKSRVMPCYLLIGDDGYLIETAVGFFANLVSLRDLNYIDRNFTTPNDIITEASQLPVMDSNRVVVVRVDLTSKDAKSQATVFGDGKLDAFIASRPPSVIVFAVKTAKDVYGKTIDGKFPSRAETVDCNRVDKSVITAWIVSESKKTEAVFTNGAVDELIKRTDGYMQQIVPEVQKLSAMRAGEKVTREDVAETVLPSLEYNAYTLTNMLLDKNPEAFDIVKDAAQKGILGLLFALVYKQYKCTLAVATTSREECVKALHLSDGYFFRLKQRAAQSTPRRLKGILDILHAADVEMKLGGVGQKEAMEMAVAKIITA